MKPNPERTGFAMAPGSFGVDVEPGGSFKSEIQISNWSGRVSRFKVEVEDFEGSIDPSETVLLQAQRAGRFGAKDWVKPEFWEFTMQPNDRLFFDVNVDVPQNADAGDHYASVLVTMLPSEEELTKAGESKQGSVVIQSRVGQLLFIRVAGPSVEQGKLRSFEIGKLVCESGIAKKFKFLCLRDLPEKTPVTFATTFENTGTVRLRPFGAIEIKNMFGKAVDSVAVEEYNVLRDSVRQMKYEWKQSGFHFGRYTASINLKRGYGEETDTMKVSFWIIPWRLILLVLAGIIIALLIMRYIFKRIEIKVGLKGKEKK